MRTSLLENQITYSLQSMQSFFLIFRAALISLALFIAFTLRAVHIVATDKLYAFELLELGMINILQKKQNSAYFVF
jgi:hypothetical protein